MLGVIELEYQVSRRPHANKQAGMGSFTGSGSGDTCFRAILRAYTAESTSPSRHGHSIRKRNSVSSAVMDLKLYFPLSCTLRASTSRLSHARTTTPATHCRKPLRVKRFTRSWKMLRMQATPACTFASTAHAGCRVLSTTQSQSIRLGLYCT